MHSRAHSHLHSFSLFRKRRPRVHEFELLRREPRQTVSIRAKWYLSYTQLRFRDRCSKVIRDRCSTSTLNLSDPSRRLKQQPRLHDVTQHQNTTSNRARAHQGIPVARRTRRRNTDKLLTAMLFYTVLKLGSTRLPICPGYQPFT